MSIENDNSPPSKRSKTTDKLKIKIGAESFRADKKLILKLSYFKIRIIDEDEFFELENTDSTYFQLFLDHLEAKQISLTDQNLEPLYKTALDLHYGELQEYIHTYMLNNIREGNLETFLQIAENHNLRKLKKNCHDFMILNLFMPITKERIIFEMSYEQFEELLKNQILRYSDLSYIKKLIGLTIEWVNHNCSNKLVNLLKILPLKEIATEYLNEILFEQKIPSGEIETLVIEAFRNKPEVVLKTGTIGERLYAIGGRDGDTLATMSMLDDNGEWVESIPMLSPRSNFGCAVIDKKIYICGGHYGKRYMNELHVYDTLNRKWTELAPMKHPRESCSMAAVDGYLYVAGGKDINDSSSKIVERYSLFRNKWTTVAKMKTQRNGLELVEMSGYLYAIGGTTDGKKWLNSVERYDPDTDQWTKMTERMKEGLAFFGSVILNDRIYAADERDFQVMDLKGEWCLMPAPTSCKGGVQLANFNGKLLAIGGRKSKKEGFKGLSRVQRYSFETSTWQAENNMDVPRCHHCLAVVKE